MDFDQLHFLTEMKFRQSQAGLAGILEEERRLRAEIARLRGLAQEARSLPADRAHMQSIGADVIWLRWVARATRDLNIQLARVLARKEGLMSQHKRAVGRNTVAEKLAAEAQKTRAAERRKSELEKVVDLSMVRGEDQ